MSKALRVVVPPHPLIGHWLTLLRDRDTPSALYATGMAELGRWLTYEALRDWIPYQRVAVQTPLAPTEGTVVDASVPLLAVPLLSGGLGLWEGARAVLPHAALAPMALQQSPAGDVHCTFSALPAEIPARAGVLVFAPQVATGSTLLHVLGQRFGDLTLYTGCIDADLDAEQRILPGVGDVEARLCGLQGSAFVG